LPDYSQFHTNCDARLSAIQIIFESSPDAMVIVNEYYDVLAVNASFVKLFSITNQELIGRQLKDYIVPREALAESESIRQAIASGQTIRMSVVRQRVNGQAVPVLLTAYPLIAKERQTGYCLIYQDVSDQVEKELAAKANEALLRAFAKAVPDKSFIFDEDGRHIEAFGEKLIKPRSELIGSTLHEVFPPEVAAIFLRQIRFTITSGKPQFTIRELEVNGEKEICEERIAPMDYLVNGRRTAAVILTDINKRTERIVFSNYALQRRSTFFNDIINGSKIVDEKAMNFAKTLGVDFSVPIFCCLLHSEQYADLSMGDAEYNSRRNLKNSLIETLGRDLEYLIWDCGDDIGVLYQGSSNGEGETDLQAVYRLQEKVMQYNPNVTIVIGVGSRQTGPESLRKSYRQAWSAVLAAECQGESNPLKGICHYKDIGILQFLARFGKEEAANEFVEETIGKLIEYDQRKEIKLMSTLEAIVQSNSLQEAANKVCLHPKSVYYRKIRIEKILEKSIDSVDTKVAISIAIKLYQISKARLK